MCIVFKIWESSSSECFSGYLFDVPLLFNTPTHICVVVGDISWVTWLFSTVVVCQSGKYTDSLVTLRNRIVFRWRNEFLYRLGINSRSLKLIPIRLFSYRNFHRLQQPRRDVENVVNRQRYSKSEKQKYWCDVPLSYQGTLPLSLRLLEVT